MKAGSSSQPTSTHHFRNPLSARRVSASTVVATGVIVAMLAGAGPAAAFNPGGGRHKVQVERAQRNHAHSRSKASGGDSMSPQMRQDLYRLRMCESGDNYRDNTGNGYYGAYQFAQQTWSNLGMAGRPDQAAPSLQDHAAMELHSRAGWSPWPACSQREHLR